MITEKELKDLIVEVVNDPDVKSDSLESDSPLIGPDGIFFDSIDVLELIVQLEKRYGVKIKDNDMIQEKLKTLNTLLEFLRQNG